MTDLFISYAHEKKDEKWAGRLAQALRSYGWTLWWDPEMTPGEEWDPIIKKELINARCVIVGWSESSVNRKWVKYEAREALKQKKFCQS